MALPGRKFSSGGEYRFGFNGKENDSETGTQDYGMRIYDARIAKFLSVDPLTSRFAMLTPYQYASNRPIDGIDLDGLEFKKHFKPGDVVNSLMRLQTAKKINQGKTGTCTIAACVYIWAKKDFKGLQNAISDLYSYGYTKYNNYNIAPDNHLFEIDPYTNPNWPYKSKSKPMEYAADWIILNSIQDSQNSIYDATGLSDDWDIAQGNSHSDLKIYFKDLLGFTNVEQKYYDMGDYKPVASILTDMQYRFGNGFSEVMSIDASMLDPMNSGGHSVVYNGNLKTRMVNGQILYSFDVISWGRNMPVVDITEADFKNKYNGSTYGKKEEAKKE